jgi:splicing factor 3B subunit 1
MGPNACSRSFIVEETPRRRSRWDQAPAATPIGHQYLVTPMRPSQGGAMIPTTFGTGISMRNAPLSDEELGMMLPSEGYKILEPPPGYAPIRTAAQKMMATPVSMGGFMIQEPDSGRALGNQPKPKFLESATFSSLNQKIWLISVR